MWKLLSVNCSQIQKPRITIIVMRGYLFREVLLTEKLTISNKFAILEM
jgi:hypothetical protein